MSIKPSTIINKAEKLLSNDENRNRKDRFLERYSHCEVYCRPVVNEYRKNNEDDETGLNSSVVKDAFSEIGVYFLDKSLVTRIFGSSSASGKSSCRWLRNKILHEMMYRAINEVCVRYDELMDDMGKFMKEVDSQT